MNNRNKRARLELSVAPSSIDAGIVNGCAVNNNQLTSNIGGTQSIFLGNTVNSLTNSTDTLSMLPTNVFLTICDENSDDSEDYLAIGSTLAQIKQEHEDALCIGGSNVSSSSSSSTQSTQTLPVQYRVVNQMQRQLPSVENIASSCTISSNNTTPTLNGTLPMQLPNGCEIYIVKEYIDNMPTILTESELLQGPPSPVTRNTTTAIKLDPDSCITSTAITAATTTTSTALNSVQILRNTTLPCMITSKLPNVLNDGRTNSNRNAVSVTTINAAAGESQSSGAKRSCILEAYKKRDDKRRATHNEVERRRRDKINNWIFRLKEMLPTEGTNNNNNNTNNQHNSLGEHGTTKTNATNGSNNSNNNSSNRTPPSDSKSQILIKACEYIKTMQDEIKSLRECLSENENLRLSNQRLQSELTKMQSERTASVGATLHTRNFNSNFNITLNSLNSNNSNGSGAGGSASSSPGGNGGIFSSLNIIPNIGSTNTFTKRELIIRDYVD